MTDSLTLQLVSLKKTTDHIFFYVGFSKDSIEPVKVNHKLKNPTSSFEKIIRYILEDYDKYVHKNMIRRLNVSFSISKNDLVQEDIFSKNDEEKKDTNLEETLLKIKKKYGSNSILRAVSYTDNATARERNKLIGGHNAE